MLSRGQPLHRLCGLVACALASLLFSGASADGSGSGIYEIQPEPLADACRFREEGLKQVVSNGTNGVVCLLSAKAVGHFGYLHYTFDLPEDVATLLNLQIILEPWEGNASLCALHLLNCLHQCDGSMCCSLPSALHRVAPRQKRFEAPALLRRA